ncbi:MAG: hypothetical protein AAF512_18065 [Pseudomonadota bacterium]
MAEPNMSTQISEQEIKQIRAQAHLHHAYLLGLQLMISTRKGPQVMEDWMFRLFRRQHEEKFLSSFEKLGLSSLPDAVACAQYHVLSNGIGGVGVEFMPETDRKAWVRFRYPRWMYHGPTICGVPVEVSRGFLKGWYAQNGVSLKNPNLGFVCVSEDMTGEYGLCGYFKEYDEPLEPEQRLIFAKDEIPPPFDESCQPRPPEDQWNPLRLEKANRNYAVEYIRNGLCTLIQVIGESETRELGGLAARLIGLQYFAETAEMIDARDGDINDARIYLANMLNGMGDTVEVAANKVLITHSELRILRKFEATEHDVVLHCWTQLWVGTMQSQCVRKHLSIDAQGDSLSWSITPAI